MRGAGQMKNQERAPKPLPSIPEEFKRFRIDPAVVERHLANAVSTHRSYTSNVANRERYLRLHIDRIIPLAHPSPIRKAS
jgi:hypothetical protein